LVLASTIEKLNKARTELDTSIRWHNTIKAEVDKFRVQGSRMHQMLTAHIPQAAVFLIQKVSNLEDYLLISRIRANKVYSVLGRSSLWLDGQGNLIPAKGPDNRGVDYEILHSANIGGTFETIDDYNYVTRTATSFKTIDLTAPSYKDSPSRIKSVIEEYTNDLANYPGCVLNQGGKTIDIQPDDIDNFVLRIGIPTGTYQGSVADVLEECYQNGLKKGITIIFDEVD
jgi:hypothetical protein